MNYEKLKEQLLSRVDDMIKIITHDSNVEIKKDKNDNILLYEVKKKKIKD